MKASTESEETSRLKEFQKKATVAKFQEKITNRIKNLIRDRHRNVCVFDSKIENESIIKLKRIKIN